MLADRFGLSLSTSSAAARDAYVDASERALTFYPGALPAYDRAIAAEPGFALAHAGKAQVLMRDGFFYGHLSWHLSLVEIALGHLEEAQQVYRDAIELGRHSGGPQQKMSDGCAFLWRSELAGHPRNEPAWRIMYDYAGEALPRPASGLADLHVILAHAVMGDDLAAWPRDALVISIAANPNGLIGGSGRLGQKHQIAELMDSVGSCPTMRWRCPKTGSSLRPGRRSSGRWR